MIIIINGTLRRKEMEQRERVRKEREGDPTKSRPSPEGRMPKIARNNWNGQLNTATDRQKGETP